MAAVGINGLMYFAQNILPIFPTANCSTIPKPIDKIRPDQ